MPEHPRPGGRRVPYIALARRPFSARQRGAREPLRHHWPATPLVGARNYFCDIQPSQVFHLCSSRFFLGGLPEAPALNARRARCCQSTRGPVEDGCRMSPSPDGRSRPGRGERANLSDTLAGDTFGRRSQFGDMVLSRAFHRHHIQKAQRRQEAKARPRRHSGHSSRQLPIGTVRGNAEGTTGRWKAGAPWRPLPTLLVGAHEA